MALYYYYKNFLIPKFTYTHCNTIPMKAVSAVMQIMIEQTILQVDILILVLFGTLFIGHQAEKIIFPLTTFYGLSIILSMITNISVLYYVCIKLYRNELYLIENCIVLDEKAD
jgi:hypothetical protein